MPDSPARLQASLGFRNLDVIEGREPPAEAFDKAVEVPTDLLGVGHVRSVRQGHEELVWFTGEIVVDEATQAFETGLE